MDKHLLEKLKDNQKTRGDIGAFKNHDDFLPWVDEVIPLLVFDEKLQNQFIHWSEHVKTNYRMGYDHRDALGEAIGVVNQAISTLEIKSHQDTKSSENKHLISEVKYPEKVTLVWLFKHVPITLWGSFLVLLFTAFGFGLYIANTGFYALLVETVKS
ncbi:hypothetical protein M9194_19610 [Vibrio sp. S4M6]|uniref:hypothetical protein n=1 Tax=Vibrio sinus TaxID=2946865 RepID=UPI00202A1425|nr:hypothetical protein [Vibrio sinus]MCL9783635.1 hypothetical protein [Vibrio sinus]